MTGKLQVPFTSPGRRCVSAPFLGPGVRPRLSPVGVRAPAAFGGPPRGPGCRRRSASEQGLALPAALDWGRRGRDRGARRGRKVRGGDGERAFGVLTLGTVVAESATKGARTC